MRRFAPTGSQMLVASLRPGAVVRAAGTAGQVDRNTQPGQTRARSARMLAPSRLMKSSRATYPPERRGPRSISWPARRPSASRLSHAMTIEGVKLLRSW